MRGLRGKVRAVTHLGMPAGEEKPGCPLPAAGVSGISSAVLLTRLFFTSFLSCRILRWLVAAVPKALLSTS